MKVSRHFVQLSIWRSGLGILNMNTYKLSKKYLVPYLLIESNAEFKSRFSLI